MLIIELLFFLKYLIYEIYKNIFGLRKRCESKTRLDGKVVVITGANTGIGKETALQLSFRGSKVIIGCRDLSKAKNTIDDIRAKNPKADITALKLDLSSLTSVGQFVKMVSREVTKIDIIVNNAGIVCPESQTEDGFEMQFQTNYLGHFLLTLSLMPLLKKSSKARIINISSIGHIFGRIHFENINLRNGSYTVLKAYCQSKLAIVLFTRELTKRLGSNTNIRTYCLHPGIIITNICRLLPWQLLRALRILKINIDIEMGVQTILYCVLEESILEESGHFYDDCKRVDKMISIAMDERSAKKLWEMSCDFVNLETHLIF